MKQIILIALACIMTVGCKDSKNPSNTGKSIMGNLKPIPSETITEYNKTATSVDLISLRKEVNVSMNFDNPQAVQYVISFIDDEAGFVNKTCKPDGHIVLQKNGEIVNEADIYYSDGCNAIVWMKDQVPSYCNGLTPEGVEFYKNFLKPRKNIDIDSINQAQKQ